MKLTFRSPKPSTPKVQFDSNHPNWKQIELSGFDLAQYKDMHVDNNIIWPLVSKFLR